MASNASTSAQSISVQSQILSQYLSLTVGFILFIGGMVGNCLNILVFLTINQYKQNACSLYMLSGSLFDLLFLLVGLTTRIMSQGFNKDLTLISSVWCKMRSSLLDILSLNSFTCVCLQSLDIFFITSRSAITRQRSNIKLARCLVIGFMFFWILHEIPSFVFQNLIFTNGTPTCITANAIYVLYHTYGTTLLFTICIPLLVISFFTFRIYKHLRLTTGRHQQFLSHSARQMTRMALYQMVIVLLFQFPYGVATAYFTGTTNLPKSPTRQLQDKLTQTFFNVYVYGLYASSFYCYYIASKRFRCQVVDTIKRFILKRRRNQILPVSIETRPVPTQQQAVPQ